MVGVILFMALGFVAGWALEHPLAWAVLLVPVFFAVAAGSNVAVFTAILGIALMALAFLAGRTVANRQATDEPAEESSPAHS